MNWEKFKDNFHESWHAKMQPFIESEACDEIYAFLKKEAGRGKKIAPLSSDVWRAFRETPLTELKVIMIGMCPYHTAKNGVPVADGLLMGCSKTKQLQPSLEKFYDGLKTEFDRKEIDFIRNPDVSYLANQGVLMLNAALTTEINKAGSHIAIWKPLIEHLFEHVFQYEGAPVIFLGKDAARYSKLVGPMKWSFVLSHPASAAYKQSDWDTEGIFTKVNKLIKEYNNYEINWLDDMPF